MLTACEVRNIFEYNADTGVLLWRHDRFGHNGGRRAIAGREAGSINVRGYRSVQVNGREYLAHRLAWIYVHGQWPKSFIDHINRNRSDNRICNLREATRMQNARNRKTSKTNKAGIRGVRYVDSCGKWMARITVNRRIIYLGTHATALDAKAAYEAAATQHFGKFYTGAINELG